MYLWKCTDDLFYHGSYLICWLNALAPFIGKMNSGQKRMRCDALSLFQHPSEEGGVGFHPNFRT
jgi:hypothetical protein